MKLTPECFNLSNGDGAANKGTVLSHVVYNLNVERKCSLLWLPIVEETSFIGNVIQRGFRIAFAGSRGGVTLLLEDGWSGWHRQENAFKCGKHSRKGKCC